MLKINNGYLRRPYVLLENRHWEIFTSKTFNIRKEVNRSFCFVLLILSCLKLPYDALQTLGHWLRHVCLCIVLLTCKEPLYWSFILVSGDQTLMHLATIFYQLLSIGPFPKKMAPKTSLQGPLWPSGKNFWLKHWVIKIAVRNNQPKIEVETRKWWTSISSPSKKNMCLLNKVVLWGESHLSYLTRFET